MSRFSIVGMALVLLLAEGCTSHEEMKDLQQRCSGGDRDACAQLNRSPKPIPVPPLPHPG
jgi:hypothetical protein